MRKIFIVILSLLLVGCNSTPAVDVSSYEAKISELEKKLEEANKIILDLGGKGNLEDKENDSMESASSFTTKDGLSVEITNMQIVEVKRKPLDFSTQDTTVLNVEFDFTNNSKENVAYMEALSMKALSMKAYQDGIKLNTRFNEDVSGEIWDNFSKEIRPNTTIAMSRLFEVNGNSPIEIEVWDTFNGNDEMIGKFNYSCN